MNGLASGLSPGFGVYASVLLSPVVVVGVFLLVICGSGVISFPVGSMQAVRLTLTLLILIVGL